MARLGDYVIIKTGKLDANASSENGKYPFFTCAIEPLKIDSYSYDCECVLVAGNGDLNVKYYNGKFDAYQRTYIIESKNKTILTVPYLYCFLDKYVEELRKQSIGGVIKYIKLGNLTEAQIHMRSMNEQNEVVVNIKKVNDLISLRKQQLSKLDELVKSRFIEMFGDRGHSSNKVCLEEISDFVTVGIANSATHAYADSGIVMLRNQNIKENYLDENDLIYITPDFAQKYGSKQLAENDILVIRTGYPGVACLVPKKYEGCQTFTTLIVRLKDSTLAHANYVCHYINSSFGKDYVEQSKVGVAQQNFGAKALAKMPIVIPSMELQEQFAKFVEQTDKSKLAIQKSLKQLETLKKSLMQKYFG